MGPLWALLLMLSTVNGDEILCDVSKNNTECYGPLGGNIQIKLMDNSSTRCVWLNKTHKIFEWKNNMIALNELKDRSDFTSETGIFQIRNLSKSDTDTYTLEFRSEDAALLKNLYHSLIVEAPVSSVRLLQECVSKREMRVNCTTDGGDSAEFSWTLNGKNLTDSQLYSTNKENNVITLRQDTEGLLLCSVKNHISKVHKELKISTCGYIFINCTLNGTQISDWVFKNNNTLCIEQTSPAPFTSVGKTSAMTPTTNNSVQTSHPSDPWYIRHWPLLAGVFGGVLIIGVAVTALFCVMKKKRKKSNEEKHDVTYADVRILQQPDRTSPPQTSDTGVEYGQVKFSKPHQQVSTAPNDFCIYANVRK